MKRMIVLFVFCVFLTSCAQRASLAPGGSYGMERSVEQVVQNADEYEIYASKLAYTTAIVFDPKGDQYTIKPLEKWWTPVEGRQELLKYLNQMNDAFNMRTGMRVIEVTAPEGGKDAAGLIYTPGIARVGQDPEQPTVVTIYAVRMNEACIGGQSTGSACYWYFDNNSN
jgi:hypothetical protein